MSPEIIGAVITAFGAGMGVVAAYWRWRTRQAELEQRKIAAAVETTKAKLAHDAVQIEHDAEITQAKLEHDAAVSPYLLVRIDTLEAQRKQLEEQKTAIVAIAKANAEHAEAAEKKTRALELELKHYVRQKDLTQKTRTIVKEEIVAQQASESMRPLPPRTPVAPHPTNIPPPRKKP